LAQIKAQPQIQTALKDATSQPETPTTASPTAAGFNAVDLLLLGCTIIWAINSPVVKIVLREFAPLAVSQFRVIIAALISLAVVWGKEKSLKIAWRHLPQLGLAAFMGITLNQITFIYALNNTSASAVSLIYAVSPVFATLLAAALMLGEIFVLPQILGGLLVIGSLLIYRLVR
jgi:drug/metabolite transporter (DMT)-like permease